MPRVIVFPAVLAVLALSPAVFAAAPDTKGWPVVQRGGEGSCGIDEAGDTWCWDQYWWAPSGSGVRERVRTGDYLAPKAEKVAGGLRFTFLAVNQLKCGLTQDGQAWCWGAMTPLSSIVPIPAEVRKGKRDCSADGAICACLGGHLCVERPVRVGGALRFVSLSINGREGEVLCGLTKAGEAWCWGGGNQANNLGYKPKERCKSMSRCSSKPHKVLGGHTWRALVVGLYHTCGIDADGKGWCWGNNESGQLGSGVDVIAASVGPVAIATDRAWRSLVLGEYSTCGLTTGGEHWCWGSDSGFGKRLFDKTRKAPIRPGELVRVEPAR